MKQNIESEQVEKVNRYGSLADLPDEELADPEELEHQVWIEMFGPVLKLPIKTKRGWIKSNMDEEGRINWGAFGTVDFDRHQPEFDSIRYKTEKLRERLRDVLILLDIVNRRLEGRTKYRVLKYLARGIIDLDDIEQEDMRALGQLYLEARAIRSKIAQLQELSRQRKKTRLKNLWASW
jgi:hypothetical protein